MTVVDIGVLFNTDRMTGSEFIEYAKRLEQAGVGSMWLAELFGREPFAAAGAVLATTSTLRVGTAIANIYARDAVAAAAASATLAELSGNRFELGLGVSNRGLNETRGHQWDRSGPTAGQSTWPTLRSARIGVPANSYPVSVAAHGPKMLAAAAEGEADAVFTYLMNPEHTARTKGDLPGRGRGLADDDVPAVRGTGRSPQAGPQGDRVLHRTGLLPPGVAHVGIHRDRFWGRRQRRPRRFDRGMGFHRGDPSQARSTAGGRCWSSCGHSTEPRPEGVSRIGTSWSD